MDDLKRSRSELLAKLSRRIRSPETLRAMAAVPRERFVPMEQRSMAYLDIPLSIGEGQTISQPTMVAEMTAALRLSSRDKVLEVGTGSGYQAAVLAEAAPDGFVVTVERLPTLAARAEAALRELDYRNVVVELAGPVPGCPERGPYDAILVAAAAPAIPAVAAVAAQGWRAHGAACRSPRAAGVAAGAENRRGRVHQRPGAVPVRPAAGSGGVWGVNGHS